MRDLKVLLTQPAACGGICGGSENVTVTLEALNAAGTSVATLSCSILTTQDSCLSVGPSATVPAGSRLRLKIANSGDAGFAAGTDAMFSWRATAP
jgi:hypothetical protein